MKNFEEKLLKRWLKRKVKITLGVVTAFLIMGISAFSDETAIIEVTSDNNGQIVITGEVEGNTFENNIYTNNSIMGNNNDNGSTYGILSNGNEIPIDIANKGTISVISSKRNGIGIYNTFAINKNIENDGIIYGKGYNWGYGIYNNVPSANNTIYSIKNLGVIKGDNKKEDEGRGVGINNAGFKLEISKILNNGFIIGKGQTAKGIFNSVDKVGEILNNGIIKGEGLFDIKGIYFAKDTEVSLIKNNGLILGLQKEEIFNGSSLNTFQSKGIEVFGKMSEISNSGIIAGINYSFMKNSLYFPEGIGVYNSENIDSIYNTGIILGKGNSFDTAERNHKHGYGIYNGSISIKDICISGLSNIGVIYGEKNAVYNNSSTLAQVEINNFNNYGLLVNKVDGEKVVEGTKVNDYGISFTALDDGIYKIDETNKQIAPIEIEVEKDYKRDMSILNASKKENGNTITGTNSFELSAKDYNNSIINGITNTLEVDSSKTITGSIINGYTNAVVFTGENNFLTLAGTVINGGLSNISDTNSELGTAILGEDNSDNLILKSANITYKNGETVTEGTIINGNIDLGKGNDNLTIDNKTQINGTINGGENEDTLTFISSENSQNFSNSSNILENSMNMLHNVNGFEKTHIDTNVTLFENITAELGDITIGESGNLILRIDTINGNSHALSGNNGTISSNGGKLLLATNGLGNGTEINLGNVLDDSIKGSNSEGVDFEEDLTLDTISFLHDVERIEGDNTKVKIVVESDLPSINDKPANPYEYNKLNEIYHSIITSKQDGEFTGVTKEKYSNFLSYLNDIYAGNPYSFSSELSRKSVNMFSDIVMGRDLHPEVNKWAIYGGLTHIDGGTKDTYFGKGYYTYDIGSKDIDVDSKITGMYAQGEYGVNETLNLGVIFGGNQSESEINSSSKVEGDSFYLGAYAKKYLGNLRLLAGVGYQYGDYEVDRVAVGYEGITTTRIFDSNYNDNTFNIYAQAKYSNKLAENLYLEPSVALDYTYVNQEGASENGVLAIETDSKDFNYTTAKFGVDLRKDIPTTTATHSLVAGAYYNRMLDGYEEENITGRFVGGSDFDILVSPSNKHEVGLRAKYEVELNNGVTFDVKGSYTFERESYSGENKNENKGEWIVGAGIGYRF